VTTSENRNQHLERVRHLARTGLEKKATDIVAMDVREVTSIADTFLIMTAASSRQVSAIAEAIREVLQREGETPLGVEGYTEGRWLLFDLNDIIVHVFIPEMRALYDLERLWHDAPRIELELPAPPPSRKEGSEPMTRPVMLVVLDGFGMGEGDRGDATVQDHLPFFEHADETYPKAQLETSGEAVGLPPGQMGNSEVGHMTMGAGRVIDQDLTRISKAIATGALDTNPALGEALDALRASGGRLHLLGLVSDGGVHSHIEHLVGLLHFCKARGIAPVVHALLDGRDTPPSSGLGYIEVLVPEVLAAGGQIATVAGRYYTMDRDNRWERVQKGYDAMVCREGEHAPDAVAAVRQAYARGETDEFVRPTIIEGGAAIADGDVVLCFNFRADRARQITNALTDSLPAVFEGKLTRSHRPQLAGYVCFAEYDKNFGLPVVFPKELPKKILGEIVSLARMTQLRIAETEKYAHVTFFFSGGREAPFPGEDRVLIASPKDVATYDHKPEMSALPVTEELLRRIENHDYDFILVNYANPDMVGHTGVLNAAQKAVQTVDRCLEAVMEAVLAKGGTALITADHGNCELMIDPETGEPHTAHTTNPVPIWWVTDNPHGKQLRDGSLADIAPTLCELLQIQQPVEMTGRSLIA